MASSSSSSSSSNWVYDVFPSFSGVDVRITYLSHLLRELDRKLIKAFKDNKIKRSRSLIPELKLAIKTSRIAVVVLSRNYASSSWCLNELLKIMKCKEKFGQVVIPVFYHLDPSDVRHQTGEFGMIFENTCRNQKDKVKVRWRVALTNLANIAGFHSVTWDNEAKMIEKIASEVSGILFLTSSKDSEDFVGIQNHITKLIFLLDFDTREGRMVGILGSSGIGKTTIARVLFNRLSRLFQSSVFVDRAFVSTSKGIYCGANPNDLSMKLHLQGKFLSEILGVKDIKISYTGAVRDRLKNHKVLIFIDDLEDHFILDTLAGHADWFGHGSRIIVITKHRHLLTAHGIDHIYEVPLPSDRLALKIFCRSAFKQNYPPDSFKELASESALRAGNLPLGLTVLGSYLRGRHKEEWMHMLLMFREGQYGKIEEMLKFCYNGLNNKNDEAIFRHLAFFKDEPINDIKLLLANNDLDVDSGIKNLLDKSLIRERCNNTLEMHSLVQEMGEEIVRAQSNEPGHREFLVDSEEISHVLEDNTGTEKVLGISLDVDKTNEFSIPEGAFKLMPNLRYLKFHSSEWGQEKEPSWHLPERFNHFPSKLKLLHWYYCPIKIFPPSFRPVYLVKLQLQRSKVEKLWEGVHSLSALRDMDMWGSENLKEIPDLSMATNLVTLNFGACSSLVELPSSIQNLQKLEMLDMSFCTSLETLPVNINLQALDHLDLSGCSRLKSFPDISTNISSLSLSQTGIEEVPCLIENFTKLRSIRMQECKELKYVSLNISKLKHLETVDFSNCLALDEASLNDNISAMAMTTEDSHSKVLLPRVELNFINCINLNQEALLQQQSPFKRLILSGKEVPSYFTHHTTATSLNNIPLLHTSLSKQFFRFLACAAVDSASISAGDFSFLIEVCCRFIDILGNHYGSAYWPLYFPTASLGSHLVIFNCCLRLNEDNAYLAKRNYDHVDIQLRLTDDSSQFRLNGWGVRLSDAEEINRGSETFGQVRRKNSAETERSRKRIKRM